MKDKLAINW